ncbi:Hypothetical predicted protein [Pelobates cultripes]|uniref:Uncharacterized protein n=1 Tax=Pelobates cultripes TaxID=61616 RepID=A0AAD1RHG3_PELCU|nr:Hypothetical predicted protein [Pelobates cultripes]
MKLNDKVAKAQTRPLIGACKVQTSSLRFISCHRFVWKSLECGETHRVLSDAECSRPRKETENEDVLKTEREAEIAVWDEQSEIVDTPYYKDLIALGSVVVSGTSAICSL